MKRKLIIGFMTFILCICIGYTIVSKKNLQIQNINILNNDVITKPIYKETINEVEVIISHVKWSPHTKVEMSRKEDSEIEVTYLKNNIKKKVNYQIWYSGQDAELISSDSSEGYGKLNEKDTKKLKMITGNKSAQILVTDYTPTPHDIVDMHGEVKNEKRFHSFLSNIKKGQFDQIRIVSYTVEGDPILHDLVYNGEEIYSSIDTRRDKFGDGKQYTTFCQSIEAEDSNYTLAGCKDLSQNNRVVLSKQTK